MLFTAKSILIQLYLKKFRLAWEHCLISKARLFQAIQFGQTEQNQTIQFSKSIVYTHLNVKIILFPTNKFCVLQFQC